MADQEVRLVIRSDGTAAITGMKQVGDGLKDLEAKAGSVMSRMKDHWMGFAAAAYAAWSLVGKAMEYADLGAKAQQTEEAFRHTADSYKINADEWLGNLKRVTAGTGVYPHGAAVEGHPRH